MVEIKKISGKYESDGDEIKVTVELLTMSDRFNNHELGDVLMSETDSDKYGIIVRDYMNEGISIPVMRLGILNFAEMTKSHYKGKDITIVIDSFSFKNDKEIDNFVCTVKEFSITYFNTEDSRTVIIIYGKENK